MAVDDSDAVGGGERTTSNQLADNISTFTDLTSDFYRGEVDRATSWRARLDQTTNWAVVIVAAILTWAFSSPDHPHYVILIGVFGVTAFLIMEATRYREYDVWRGRVRMIQEELLAEMYAPDGSGDDDWQTELGTELRNPRFSLSFRQAITHRLRRSYLALLLILLAAWVSRITLLESDESWQTTAGMLGVPGEIVTTAVAGFYVVIIALTVWSARGERVQEFQE